MREYGWEKLLTLLAIWRIKQDEVGEKNVLISEKVYENISKDVQDYFSKCQIDSKTYYESDIVWSEYEDWIEQNYN